MKFSLTRARSRTSVSDRARSASVILARLFMINVGYHVVSYAVMGEFSARGSSATSAARGQAPVAG
jgi:hypothetical protein